MLFSLLLTCPPFLPSCHCQERVANVGAVQDIDDAKSAFLFLLAALRLPEVLASPQYQAWRPSTSTLWEILADYLRAAGSQPFATGRPALRSQPTPDDGGDSQKSALRLNSVFSMQWAALAIFGVTDDSNSMAGPSRAALQLFWDVLTTLLRAAKDRPRSALLASIKLLLSWLYTHPSHWSTAYDDHTFVLAEATPAALNPELWRLLAEVVNRQVRATGLSRPPSEDFQQANLLPEDVAFLGFKPLASATPAAAPVLHDPAEAARLRAASLAQFAVFVSMRVLLPATALDTSSQEAPMRPALILIEDSTSFSFGARPGSSSPSQKSAGNHASPSAAAELPPGSQAEDSLCSSASQVLLTPPVPRGAVPSRASSTRKVLGTWKSDPKDAHCVESSLAASSNHHEMVNHETEDGSEPSSPAAVKSPAPRQKRRAARVGAVEREAYAVDDSEQHPVKVPKLQPEGVVLSTSIAGSQVAARKCAGRIASPLQPLRQAVAAGKAELSAISALLVADRLVRDWPVN